MQKCLVTGGAGFIGSNLVERLMGDGVQVRVLDNLTTGVLDNIEPFLEDIDFKQGDVRDLDALQEVMAGVEVVFHQAAVVSVPKSVEDPIEAAMVNDLGTLYVLEAARRASVRRVVFASSCAVYGDLPQLPKRENMETRPLSPYAASKLHGETYALLYRDLYGLETVCLRYFNVYGPKQDPTSPYSGVISIFMDRAVRGELPTIFGDGEQFRDFVYVADVVQANLLAANRDNIAGAVINLGTGSSVTVNSLWANISQFAGVGGEPERVEERPGDIRESVADISRARELLAYEPLYSFEEGLKLTWEWYSSRSTRH
ncbi:MAG: SDR family oxidoreductase [Deltaproteobacteria bacterium]|jgi:nucleoside-diphosphate-sugar epimerase|nr:SDR family oxidoreductase [Deltaproteobacteria bacterium]